MMEDTQKTAQVSVPTSINKSQPFQAITPSPFAAQLKQVSPKYKYLD